MGELVSDYTPTTEEIRHGYSFSRLVDNPAAALGYFDRWFASEIAKAEERGREQVRDED